MTSRTKGGDPRPGGDSSGNFRLKSSDCVHRPLTVFDDDTLGKVTDDNDLFLYFPQEFYFDKTRFRQ